MRRSVSLFAALISAAPLVAQPDSSNVTPIRAGVAAGVSLNTHAAGFVKLPGTPNCCPLFESGFGIGPYIALLGYLPVSESVRLDLRAGYMDRSATLSRSEPIAVEGPTGPIPTTVEHSIDGNLGSIDGELRAEFAAASNLWLGLGTRVGAFVRKDFSQIEILGDEAPGTFENGQRTRNAFDGEIPNANGVGVSLLLAASYDLPLDPDGYLRASPELTFGLALSSINDSVDWMPHAIQAGVVVSYDFAKYKKPEPIVVPEPPLFQADVSFSPVSGDGSIRATEHVDIIHSPIIPAVFFDSASALIDERYRSLSAEQAAAYSLTGFDTEDFVKQHGDVLNVIGYRLKNSTGTTITLVPSNASDESKSVATARVNTIRDYLQTRWGIGLSRMKIESGNDPLRKASEKYEDGRVENRHVGIRASDPRIVAPISTQSERWQFSPESVTINPTITADAGIRNAELEVSVDGKTAARYDFGSSEWQRGNAVNWRVDDKVIDVNKLPATLTANLTATDQTGRTIDDKTDSSLRVVSKRNVSLGRIERLGRVKRVTYQLVAVPLGSPELDPINHGLMAELASQVRPGAKVTIRGYADRLGDPAYNMKLSQKRSEIATNSLRQLLPADVRDNITIDAQGGGVDNSRFTNDLPEGRVLTRGVSVILEQEE